MMNNTSLRERFSYNSLRYQAMFKVVSGLSYKSVAISIYVAH